jgi:hypothetical protein
MFSYCCVSTLRVSSCFHPNGSWRYWDSNQCYIRLQYSVEEPLVSASKLGYVMVLSTSWVISFVLKSLNISLDLECKKVWRYQSKIRSNMNWYILCVTFYSDDSVCFSLLFNSLFCTIACTKLSIYRLKRRTAITSIGLSLITLITSSIQFYNYRKI